MNYLRDKAICPHANQMVTIWAIPGEPFKTVRKMAEETDKSTTTISKLIRERKDYRPIPEKRIGQYILNGAHKGRRMTYAAIETVSGFTRTQVFKHVKDGWFDWEAAQKEYQTSYAAVNKFLSLKRAKGL